MSSDPLPGSRSPSRSCKSRRKVASPLNPIPLGGEFLPGSMGLGSLGVGMPAGPSGPAPPTLTYSPAPVLTTDHLDRILAANHERTSDHLDCILAANRESMLLLLQDWSASVPRSAPRRRSGSRSPAPAPVSKGSSRRLHLNLPPEFDGSSANVVNFLAMIRSHIIANPLDFTEVKTQVIFLLSYCSKGFAMTWRNRLMAEIDCGDYEVTTWDAFETLFKDSFLNHYSADNATREIALIRQGKLPAQEFLISFDELVVRCDFNDRAVIYALKNALNPALLREINRTTSVLTTYADWRRAALEQDHKLREVEASLAHSQNWWKLPFSSRPYAAPPAPANATPPPPTPAPHASLPASLSAPVARPRTDLASMACHNCSVKGHLARSCPKPYDVTFRRNARARLAQARSMLEQFDALLDADHPVSTSPPFSTVFPFCASSPVSATPPIPTSVPLLRSATHSFPPVGSTGACASLSSPTIPCPVPVAPTLRRKASCVDIPEIGDCGRVALCTANGELLYNVCKGPPPPASTPVAPPLAAKTRTTPARNKPSTVESLLQRCREAYPDTHTIGQVLGRWVACDRLAEVDDKLVSSICFLDSHLAIQVLDQLQEPKGVISRVGSSSMDVKLAMRSVPSSLPVPITALLDSGASGCYIHEDFVALHNIPVIPLPHPIAVYNVDGTRNLNGSIKNTVLLEIAIGDHVKNLRFSVTNTGSSSLILGLSWLHFHNPFIDFKSGKLCFSRCPLSCRADVVQQQDPDACVLRELAEVSDAPSADMDNWHEDNRPSQGEWADTFREILGPDEQLLCVDLNECPTLSPQPVSEVLAYLNTQLTLRLSPDPDKRSRMRYFLKEDVFTMMPKLEKLERLAEKSSRGKENLIEFKKEQAARL
ncbi:hypothetical protein CVT25_004989 [Psilocybe cyanescens]|uniref:CCHC-type domain-containing protein n=1 Tax=Psilocybe cyanescens TaxID=93625 RepID=A0A409X271_PSICY|nr:hypothetical protein CVT25_004989 [Psilocybe cyanescens]